METSAAIAWGTNPARSKYYAGRTHMVSRDGSTLTALCGLPVEYVWEQRPSSPDWLCPECCQVAIALLYPVATEQRLLIDATNRADSHYRQSRLLLEST